MIEHAKGLELTVGGEPYRIQGPGASFPSHEAAAKDGLALGFAMEALVGNDFERGGVVNRHADGSYSYPELVTGTVAKDRGGEQHRHRWCSRRPTRSSRWRRSTRIQREYAQTGTSRQVTTLS